MDFHLELTPRAFDTRIRHKDKIMLIGSCFTEQIGNKLAKHKFRVMDNPNGILFNPLSITKSINSYLVNKHYREDDLFYQNECWNSWDHHSRFSNIDKERCLQLINDSRDKAHAFLKEADWLLITLGSAYVYELKDIPDAKKDAYGSLVANCHKVPTDKFNKRLLEEEEIIDSFQQTITELVLNNPSLKIIFTISPVRHLREGFVENNISKATLIKAVHKLTCDKVFYFPAYELIIDDLRDYRFYAEDMIHPNYSATNYVWNKFVSTCMDDESVELMKEINEINAAHSHKAFNPGSVAHQKFKEVYRIKVIRLQEKYPYLQLDKELEYFKAGDGNSA